ncbi:MAG: sulfotransferase [Cyanobacteria bacterium P01_A01_bin.17]
MMPNFLIIGAPRCGTTSLYYNLATHPQIYMSQVKEMHFFHRSKDSISEDCLSQYQSFFRNASQEFAVGEATPSYLFDANAPDTIKSLIPEVKLIAILRNPADPVYSQYLLRWRNNKLTTRVTEKELLKNFASMIREYRILKGKEEKKIFAEGFYREGLARYRDNFGQEQMRIYLFEDFKVNPRAVLEDICQFLCVDAQLLNTEKTSQIYNKGNVPKSRVVHESLENLRRIYNKKVRSRSSDKTLSAFSKNVNSPLATMSLHEPIREAYLKLRNYNSSSFKAPQLPENIRAQLNEIYKEDILSLQVSLKKDLISRWLEV